MYEWVKNYIIICVFPYAGRPLFHPKNYRSGLREEDISFKFLYF